MLLYELETGSFFCLLLYLSSIPKFANSASRFLNGCSAFWENTVVISEKLFQAIFLPLLKKPDVVSQPVNSKKNGNAIDFVSPIDETINKTMALVVNALWK